MRNLDVDRMIAGWRGPALAALVAVLAVLPGLLLTPPIDRDESRYAEASAQMLETGDFVNISFQDQPRHKKPVGIYWMQAASSAVLSPGHPRTIWPYRIPSLLGAALAAAACAWGAAMFWGARSGTLAGIALGSTMLLSTEGFFGTTDGALAGTTTLAMATLARLYGASRGLGEAGFRTRLLFWLALAAAILIKGPIGPMVVALTLIALAVWDRDASWMKATGWRWGVPLMLVITLPWAIAITVVTHGAFWKSAVVGDLASKVEGGQESHGAWPGYYLLTGLVVAFPLTLLIPAAISSAWTRGSRLMISVWLASVAGLVVSAKWKALGAAAGPVKIVLVAVLWALLAASPWLVARFRKQPVIGEGAPTLEPGVRFALCWLIPSWLVFELAPTKLPHYVLPVYGALAWLAVAALARPLDHASRWAGVALLWLGGAALAGLAVIALSQFGKITVAPWATLTVGFALAAALAGGFLTLRRASATGLLVACGFAVLAHATLAVEAANLRVLWPSRNLAVDLDHLHLTKGPPVTLVGYGEASAVFALGTHTVLAHSPSEGADAIAQGRTAVVEGADGQAFLAALAARGLRAEPIAFESGYNYSKGHRVTLTIYRPVGR
jgi:4-amino-4-deoxy-L-arabinose transferase-like glycosyltransferase